MGILMGGRSRSSPASLDLGWVSISKRPQDLSLRSKDRGSSTSVPNESSSVERVSFSTLEQGMRVLDCTGSAKGSNNLTASG